MCVSLYCNNCGEMCDEHGNPTEKNQDAIISTLDCPFCGYEHHSCVRDKCIYLNIKRCLTSDYQDRRFPVKCSEEYMTVKLKSGEPFIGYIKKIIFNRKNGLYVILENSEGCVKIFVQNMNWKQFINIFNTSKKSWIINKFRNNPDFIKFESEIIEAISRLEKANQLKRKIARRKRRSRRYLKRTRK